MAIHFYVDSSRNGNSCNGEVIWENVLEKPKLVTHIENSDGKLIIYYEDNTREEIEIGIKGVNDVQPLMYYGTNVKGEIGFHYIPIGGDAHVNEMEQRVLLNVKNGEKHTIQSKHDMSESKTIVQTYKLVHGEEDVINTIKEFNNGENDNFYYDKNNILFDGGCSIKKEFDLNSYENNGMYETGLIEKNKFIDFSIGEKYNLNREREVIKDITPIMTSPTTPSPYVVSSDSEYSANWAAWKAFDGIVSHDRDIGWVTDVGDVAKTNPFIKMDFGRDVRVDEIWLGAYRYNYTHATLANIEYSNDDKIYHSIISYLSLTYRDTPYHKYKLPKTVKGRYFKITILKSISTSYSGFSEIKFICNSNNFLIKKDNSLYTINSNELVEIEGDITEEIFENMSIELEALNENLNILPEVFSLVSDSKVELVMNGLQDRNQLIVASNDFCTVIQEHIDYFKCESDKVGSGQIKVAFSLDSGTSWKTHNGIDFVNLDIEIPMKEFENLSNEELDKWNNAKTEILANGIDVDILENLDFNTIDFDKIRFAYVLHMDSTNDVAINKNLIWQFDAKGSMQKMKDNEYDLNIHSNGIEFKSLIDTDIIKINIVT